VDSWRQIAVAANALFGVFNVRYHFETTTPAGEAKPFAFGGSRNQHQLIMNFDAPLVRTLERNNYRSALIAYQRQRRELMAEEDSVLEAVRFDIRQLRLLAENYKIQKRAVELAYRQVEQASETINQPPTPTGPTGGGNVAANSAALTQQLLNAQQRLPQVQNQMLSVWVNYLVARMSLYRDLELMPLDSRGVWTDDIAACQCGIAPDGEASPAGSAGTGPNRPAGERQPERLPEPQRVPVAPSPAHEPAR
jgi:hypothetical protein